MAGRKKKKKAASWKPGAVSETDLTDLAAVLASTPTAFSSALATFRARRAAASGILANSDFADGPVEEDVTSVSLADLLRQRPRFSAYCERSFRPAQTRGSSRDFQISFGPESGKAGETKVLTVQPRCLFRGQKIVATDTATPPGSGTKITGLLVGRKSQFPAKATSIPTAMFSANSLGRGVSMDTCDAALSITMTVEWLKDCTFDACIFGRAIA